MGFARRVEDVMEFKEQLIDKLNVAFGDWAIWVYDRPYKVITGALILSIIPAIGFVPPIAKWVDGADNLYSLPVSEARNDGLIRDHIFQDGISRAEFLTITSSPAGTNLLDWDMIEWIRQIDDIVKGKRADAKTGEIVALPANELYYPEWFEDPSRRQGNSSNGSAPTPDKTILRYEDMCAPDPVMGCKVQSIFEMGIDDMKLMLDANSPPELWIFDGYVFNSKRKGFSPEFVFGTEFDKKNCSRDVPTSLISQIYSADRYTELEDRPGYATANFECIYNIRAMRFVYEMWDQPQFLQRELAWEWNLYEILKNNEYYGPLHIGCMAYRTRDDELSKSTAESDDVIFVVYTFILLITYAAVINFNLDQYRSKGLSSLIGSLSCLLGLYAGLGVPPLWGTCFVPTALVCPFIVMGVGADDIFVIIGSYALTYGEETPRDRCAVTLRGSGVSVVMTTLTNVIAFAIGLQTQYLSIKNFCVFTMFGLLFSLIYELTLFWAVVCLEAKKEEAQKACICGHMSTSIDRKDRKKRYDICSSISTYQLVSVLVEECLRENPSFSLDVKDEKEPGSKETTGQKLARLWDDFKRRGNYWHIPDMTNSTPPTAAPAAVESAPLNETDEYMRFMPKQLVVDRYDLHPKLQAEIFRHEPPHNVGAKWRTFFMKHYCRFIFAPYVKVIVLIVFSANFAISLYGMTQLQQGLEMPDLSPDNSYLKQYDRMTELYLSKTDLPVEMFYVGDQIPWHELRVIETMRTFVDTVQNDPSNYLLNDPLTRMVDDAHLHARLASGNETEFNRALWEALTDSNSAYKQFEYDFVWHGGRMMTYRQQLLPVGTAGSTERAKWMLKLRAHCAEMLEKPESDEHYPLDARFYNYMLVFYESDITIKKSVIASITTASMALLVVTLMLIPDLTSGLLVIFIMFLIDVAVIGYMPFWDVPLNMISMVILVISIGFAVDYSAHLCYAFVNAVGPTRNIRTAESMVLIGTPLFHGAMSNFLGIVMLGMSTSYILRIFFKMMTLVVLLGISHGLILLPVILGTWSKVAQAQLVTLQNIHTVTEAPGFKLRNPSLLNHIVERRGSTELLRTQPTAANQDEDPKDSQTPVPIRL